jgi:hypothetical protein
MSKENRENLFYADKVISARDAVESILAYYPDYLEKLSPEMRFEIDGYIATIQRYLDIHYKKVDESEDYNDIPW